MARKSVIAGEYIIEIADNGHVDVLRVYSNLYQTMRTLAKSKGFSVDEKWNTQDLGRKLVKEFGDGEMAHFGDVVVKRLPTQQIEIYEECRNVIAELRTISDKMGFPYEESWNTQTFGSKLVDYLLENKEKADKVLQTKRGSRTSDAAVADPSSSVIKLIVDREKSETIDLTVTATGEVSIEGVEEPLQADGESHEYTLTADEVVIRGAVTDFRCGSWSTGVTHLDLSGCPTLTSLDCRGLLVEELDLSKCVNLTELSLESCDELASLDLSKLVNLTKLSLKSCDQLPSLDLSKLVNLTELSLDPFDKFTSLDLSKFVNLMKLSLDSCGQLASLDLSKLVNLTDLSLSSCDQLTSLDLTKCVNLTRLYLDPNSSFFGDPDVQLTSLDLSKLVNLTNLSISSCDKLTSLDLSKLVNLTDLSISSCDQLTSLDLSKLVNLTKLSISSCDQLTSLDLSKLVNLTKLSLWSCSQLPNLDLSKCVKLTDFDCRGFELLPSLDLSQCVNLTDISLGESPQLTSLDLSKLVNLTSVRFWSCKRLASVDLSGSKELNSLNVSSCDSLEIIRCHTEAVPNLNLKAIKLPTVKEEGNVTLIMSEEYAEKGQADSQEITEVIQADPDDCPYELMIYSKRPIRATEIFTFDERTDEVDQIEELIKSGDTMELWENYYGEGKLFAILDLWGGDEGLFYEVTDEDKIVVEGGSIEIPEDAVCDFGNVKPFITEENHPKYILIRREYRRGATSYYKIPKDLDLEKCTFPSIRAFESFSLIYLNWEGDTMTGIEYGFRCDGVEYSPFYSEFDDGESDFALYEYDEDKGRYMEVATTIWDEE